MTRRKDSAELSVHAAQRRLVDDAVAAIFKGAPAWQPQAALAAIYRIRPELGVEADPELHALHMWKWPRDDLYFARVCRLLKMYGIGFQWSVD